MTGSQVLALQKQRNNVVVVVVVINFCSWVYGLDMRDCRIMSNHVENVENVVKAIPSLQTLGVFRPKKLTKMLSTEQQRKNDGRCDIRHKANRLMEFALQSHSDLRLLVWGTWEDDDEIQAFLRTPLAVRSIGEGEFVDSIELEQVKYEIPESGCFGMSKLFERKVGLHLITE